MNTRKWLITSGTVVLAALVVLALAVGLTQAQGPEPPGREAGAEGDVGAAAVVGGKIPVQGRLTDASGNPLDGAHTVTASIYDVSTGGTALCTDEDNVTVDNGLFNMNMNYCSSSDISGEQLYLGIQVGSDAEMTPRQAIYPVPYAYRLRPGAVISSTIHDAILDIENWHSSGRGLRAYAMAESGANYGVVGASRSPDGYGGYFYNNSDAGGTGLRAWSEASVGLEGYSYDDAHHYPGVFGCAADSAGTCDPYRDDNGAGVMGYSQSDYGGYFVGGTAASGGVHAEANHSYGMGVWAQNNGGGAAVYAQGNAAGGTYHRFPTLYLVQADSAGDFVVGASSAWGTRYWRVDRTGKGFFNGGAVTGGADFAEQMAVEGKEADYEPGDVLVISGSADRMVELSTESFATAVIGVYSTEPGVLAGAPDTDDPLGGIPVAITGIAPCKVSAENGAIHRGDLLVTASLDGHAMLAGPNPPQGTVLGKALGELGEGTGIIEILVTLQ